MAESVGDWPDEYQLAAGRLYAMFDAIDAQFVEGQLDEHVQWIDSRDPRVEDHQETTDVVIEPIVDSLATARIAAVCEIGFQFNATTLLCGQ